MVILLFLAVLACTTSPTYSQAESGCAINSCIKDSTCNTPSCADGNRTGCESQTFTVPCNGRYCLTVETTCPPDVDCQLCRTCASVYKGDYLISTTCYTRNECDAFFCDNRCCPETMILTAGVTYTLYVCKSHCIGASCASSGCTENNKCYGYGCIISN